MPRLIIVLDCPLADPARHNAEEAARSLLAESWITDEALISAHWSDPDTPEPVAALLEAARTTLKVLGHMPQSCMYHLRVAVEAFDPDTPEERES